MVRSPATLIRLTLLLPVLLFSFAARGAVSGTVIDLGGSPIEGALVVAIEEESDLEQRIRWLRDDPSPARIAEATTDAKGNYTLELDEPLTAVTIEISAPGRLPLVLRVPHDGWIGASVLRQAEMVHGRVISGGEPVAGARVIMAGLRSEIRTVTDEQGRISLPQLQALTLAIVHPDHAPFQEQRFQPQRDFTIRLDGGVSISGRVVDPKGESPVANAVVTIDGWPLGTSDEDGTFTTPNAPKQWSTAKVSSGNLTTQLTRATARSTTIQLRRAATVTGTVVDSSSGRGIPRARVLLGDGEGFRSGTRRWTWTDASGRFSFSSVLPGSYSLTTSHPSWDGRIDPVTVVGDNDVDRRIETERTAAVRGRAIDERGQPVAGASVAVDVEESDALRFARFRMQDQTPDVRTAPDGRFFAFGIPADKPVRLSGTHPSRPAAKSDRLELDAGETATGATLVFPRGVSLTGTVTTSSGAPISNAAIRVSESNRGARGGQAIFIRSGEGADQPALTDAQGRFDVKVAEGAWDVSVTADGFAPARMNAIDPRQNTEPLKVVLEEGTVVQGRVVRGGIGIPAVDVIIPSTGLPNSVTTGPDGSFTLENLPRGQVTVLAIKRDELIREMRMVEAPARDLVIEVPPGGAIRGRVVDESTKEPVTDFQAGPSADRGSGGGIRMVTGGNLRPFHGDDGEFFIDNVPPGRTELVIEAPGYVEKTLKGIDIVAGETVDGLEVALSRGVRVTGTVRGDDGAPLGEVSVRIDDGEENPLAEMMPHLTRGHISTDSSGRYTIPAAPPGETTLVFTREGFVPARRSADLKGRETRVDVTLSSGTDVSGTVVTASGAPVSGASVRAVSAVQGSRRNYAETDGEGRFTLKGLVEGRYTFVATHPRYAGTTREGVDVSAAQPVRMIMEEGGTIVGRVLGADPSTYGSINVQARGSSGGSRSPVSPDGTFRIEGVQPGTTRVSATMGRMFDSRSSETETVEVTAGLQASVDLRFTDGSRISGRVTRFGEPLRSGVVRLSPSGGSGPRASASIDSEGRYSVGGLERGTYELFVTDMQTPSPYSKTVQITSDSQTIDIDIRGGRITGRIRDATSGQPIENAVISVGRTEAGQAMLRATTGPSGEFVIDSVPEGSYRLRVERAGYGHATRDLLMRDDQDESVELSLQPDDGLTLRVVDRRDGRALSADIVVHDARNVVAWSGRPSPRADGTIRIPVASGTYRVSAWATGYAPSNLQISSDGAPQTIALTPGGTLVIESRARVPVRARLLDQLGAPYPTSRWNHSGEVTLAPGTNRLNNLAPGPYTIQILGDTGAPATSEGAVVREGETTAISI
jgi:large repetitive protein